MPRNFTLYSNLYAKDMIDRILLFPYYLTLKLRDRRYSNPKRKLFVPEVPCISVGNVTVGGTGKTPHVEMILRLLKSSDHWGDKHLAVLSRGYKRESRGFQQVMAAGSAAMYGDEPLQIKNKFPDVTVAVDKNRVEGCGLLCHPEKLQEKKYAKKCWDKDFPPADYIILDDAFQYRKLKPARSVVLVDYNRPVHKDMLLPLGRLRDLSERVGDADVVIVSKCPQDIDADQKCSFALEMGFKDYDPQLCEGIGVKGKRQTLLFTCLAYETPKMVFEGADNRYVYAKKLILVTGIAKDTALRNHLSDKYKIVARFNFPDHHKYNWSDINKIKEALRKNPLAAIATTEKDMQRLLDYKGMPKDIKERLFMVPIKTHFVSEVERSAFADIIENL